jgi:hypothetical protein
MAARLTDMTVAFERSRPSAKLSWLCEYVALLSAPSS